MDVPTWHPASQASSTEVPRNRTEFKDVSTLTEEELTMLVGEDKPVLGGGRGLLDPSDRLYLVEQTLLEQQTKSREQIERRAALQTFRSNALKVHAHKTSVPEIPLVPEKKLVLHPQQQSAVVVKVKKRKPATVEKEKKAKKTKNVPSTGYCAIARNDNGLALKNVVDQTGKNDAVFPSTKSPATTLLVEDYSSDDDKQ